MCKVKVSQTSIVKQNREKVRCRSLIVSVKVKNLSSMSLLGDQDSHVLSYTQTFVGSSYLIITTFSGRNLYCHVKKIFKVRLQEEYAPLLHYTCLESNHHIVMCPLKPAVFVVPESTSSTQKNTHVQHVATRD